MYCITSKKSVLCNTLRFLSNDPKTAHNKDAKYFQHAQTFDPHHPINLHECKFSDMLLRDRVWLVIKKVCVFMTSQ